MAPLFTIGLALPNGSFEVVTNHDGFPEHMLSRAAATEVLWSIYEQEASRGLAKVIEAYPYMPYAGLGKLPHWNAPFRRCAPRRKSAGGIQPHF